MSILKIVETKCWKCDRKVRLAFLDNTVGVHEFDDKLIEISRKYGVVIKKSYSKTIKESYNANICTHCDAVFGQWYLPGHWYSEVVESIDLQG